MWVEALEKGDPFPLGAAIPPALAASFERIRARLMHQDRAREQLEDGIERIQAALTKLALLDHDTSIPHDSGNPMVDAAFITINMLGEELEHALDSAEKARRAAVEANHTKSVFLANMSHELRTPLNAIIGFSDVMRREMFGPLPNPRYREYVRDINVSGEHLLHLINQVLDMSKAESGQLELAEEAIDIEAMTTAAFRMVTPQADKAGVALDMTIEPGLPALLGERLRVTEVLLNLLSNAVKFTDAGGRVTVAAACTPAGELTMTVADTGVGMSAADIPRALAPFVQLENNRGRNLAGTGLGLPLARKMTELHGGTLDVVSSPGAGTKVTLVFPAVRVQRERLSA